MLRTRIPRGRGVRRFKFDPLIGDEIETLQSVPSSAAEILKEALPRLRRAAAIWCPDFPNNQVELQRIRAAAKTLRLQVEALEYTTRASWDATGST